MVKPTDFLIMHYERDMPQAEVLATIRTYSTHAARSLYQAQNPDAPKIGLYAVRKMKPSPEMLHVLKLARNQGADISWVPLVNGKGSQSRTVGRSLTIEACQRRGWLDGKGNITQAGREIAPLD